MPAWNNVLNEISRSKIAGEKAIDSVRRKYLKLLNKHTGRSVIAYYSGWLSRPHDAPHLDIGDDDMNAFMATVHNLPRKNGLDLILHTPGGNIAATEAIVNYLREMFGKDIRAIVPQIAMSAGTMIACSTKKIVLGKQSSLGPIDPQMYGMPAQGVLNDYHLAVTSIKNDPASTPIWQQIMSRCDPSFLTGCIQAIRWSREMVRKWLLDNMLENDADKEQNADKILAFIASHENTASHERHLSMSTCEKLGLEIELLENDDVLQDLVLTVHHAFMHTFSMTPANKIVENHLGVAMIQMNTQVQVIRGPA